MTQKFDNMVVKVEGLLSPIAEVNVKKTAKWEYRNHVFVTSPFAVLTSEMEFNVGKIELTYGVLVDFSISPTLGERHGYIKIEEPDPRGRSLANNIVLLFNEMKTSEVAFVLLQNFTVSFIAPMHFSHFDMIEKEKTVFQDRFTAAKKNGEELFGKRSDCEWEKEWEGAAKSYNYEIDWVDVWIDAKSRKDAETQLPKGAKKIVEKNAAVIGENPRFTEVPKIDWEIEDEPRYR